MLKAKSELLENGPIAAGGKEQGSMREVLTGRPSSPLTVWTCYHHTLHYEYKYCRLIKDYYMRRHVLWVFAIECC